MNSLNSKKNSFKIAIIGGGIFGVTTAIKLAEDGHKVDLFEKEKDILMAASGTNQFRLHRGYHYPRSKETIKDCIRTEAGFVREYGPAVISEDSHYYSIAKEGSLINYKNYLKVCKDFGLSFVEKVSPLMNPEKIALTVMANEKRIDPDVLKKNCWQKLKKVGVKIKLGETVGPSELKNYDFKIIATYASINDFLQSSQQNDYQFELCEKPVVKLPREFNGQCLVVMDGPFMCIDPMGRTGNFLLGNVTHAIHQTNIGKLPEFNKKLKPLLNKGIIRNPPVTNFKKFIESGSEFIPGLTKAKHVGSMFTFRTVLPHKEKTDERPTVVNKIDSKTITIFSGKLGNCVEASEKVSAIIGEA